MDSLLEQIAAGPAEREVELLRIYADQLVERGDGFGELIVVATTRLAATTPELARREEALIAARATELAALAAPDAIRLAWRRGFVDRVALDHGVVPVERIVAALAERRELRLLRRLEIEGIADLDRRDLGPTFATLATLAGRLPRLAELVIREPWERRPAELGDVTPLYAAFPRLEVLELDGDRLELGEIVLPQVRRFLATYLRVDDARRIVAAVMPRLADLELAFAPRRIGDVAATFGPLLHRDFGPQLEALSLALPDVDAQRWAIGELAEAPIARHLRRLAFRRATLDDACRARLIADRARYRRLDRLELEARTLSAITQGQLRRAYGSALVLI